MTTTMRHAIVARIRPWGRRRHAPCFASRRMLWWALPTADRRRPDAVPCSPHDDHWPWYDIALQNIELEAVARRAFPEATRIIILAAGDPGGTLFHDVDAEWQAAGIAATSWDEATGTLYLRRLPPPPRPRSDSDPPTRPACSCHHSRTNTVGGIRRALAQTVLVPRTTTGCTHHRHRLLMAKQ